MALGKACAILTLLTAYSDQCCVILPSQTSLLYNFTPSTKPYRASDSQFFIQVVLLGAYVACILPIVYVMWR